MARATKPKTSDQPADQSAPKRRTVQTASGKKVHIYKFRVDVDVAETLTRLAEASDYSIQHMMRLAMDHLIRVWAPHYGIHDYVTSGAKVPPEEMVTDEALQAYEAEYDQAYEPSYTQPYAQSPVQTYQSVPQAATQPYSSEIAPDGIQHDSYTFHW